MILSSRPTSGSSLQINQRLLFRWLAWSCLVLPLASGCSLFSPDPSPNADVASGDYPVEPAGYEEDDISLSDFSPSQLPTTLRKLSGEEIQNEGEAKQQFAQAEALYKQAEKESGSQKKTSLLSAAAKFEAAAENFPKSAIEHDGLYLAGESYFFADHYIKANDRFEMLLKKYPNSRLLDQVEARRLAIAQYWEAYVKDKPEAFYGFNYLDQRRPYRDTRGHALRIYDKIRLDDPTGKYAEAATMALANAHFESGDYISADLVYTDLRTTFPDSKYQFAAHFKGMKAKLLTYRGPAYSSVPLVEAEKLAKQMQRLFPGDVRENYETINTALAEIQKHKAEREMHLARYYDARGENRAARYHYDIVASEYSDTPLGDQAGTRLAALGGKPAKPPQRLSWLVNMFPETEDVKPLLASDPNSTVNR